VVLGPSDLVSKIREGVLVRHFEPMCLGNRAIDAQIRRELREF
jgi:hypothetical protein